MKNFFLCITTIIHLISFNKTNASETSSSSSSYTSESSEFFIHKPKKKLDSINIDLETAKRLLLTDNIDVTVASEKLFRAQENIYATRSIFLPNAEWLAYITAAGIIGSPIFASVLIGSQIIKIPEKIYFYQSQKELANAEYYALEAVIMNFEYELAKILFTIYVDQTLLDHLKLEHDEIKTYIKHIEQGITYQRYNTKRLQEIKIEEKKHESFMLTMSRAVTSEIMHLKVLLGIPRDTLVTVNPYIPGTIPADLSYDEKTLANTAKKNSPEIAEYQCLIQAAKIMKKSKKWSILSFEGMGLGHISKIEIAQSHIEELEARHKDFINRLENQVAASITSVTDSLRYARIAEDENILTYQQAEDLSHEYEQNPEDYEGLHRARRKLLRAKANNEISKLLTQASVAQLARTIGYEYVNGYSWVNHTMEERPLKLDLVYEIKHTSKNTNHISAYLTGSYLIRQAIDLVEYSPSGVKTISTKDDRYKKFPINFDTKLSHSTLDIKIYFKSGKTKESHYTLNNIDDTL